MPVALAALTIYMGFEAGGYFADTTGWVTAGLAIALAIRALAVGRPPRGLTWPLAWAAGALALLAVWILLSAAWSDAPARALLEFDRVLMYVGVLLLFGTASNPERTLRRVPQAFLFAAVVLCGAGLLARTLPNDWPFSLPPIKARMDWPLTYENALGALAALGMVMALAVASWRREHPATRVLAAASLPILAAALVLTFSRGGALTAVVGIAVYLVLCRSRGAVTAVVATAPFTYLAVRGAFDADHLATTHIKTPAALSQGQHLAGLVFFAMAAVVVAMTLLLLLERRLGPARVKRQPSRRARRLRLGATLAAAITVLVVVLAAGLPGEVYRKVVQNHGGGTDSALQSRLTDPSSITRGQNRPKYWRVSLDAFDRHPVAGSGAGTFGLDWARDRTVTESTTEGHSVYLETLGELGIVGGLLILGVLGSLLWPSVARLGGERRPLYAGVLAASVAWAVHAGIDWDWEMPVLTIWLFAAGGCALAASSKRVAPPGRPPWGWRAVAAVLCGLAALTPATVAISQQRLNTSVEAFKVNDCRTASAKAQDSIGALDTRPEPYSIVAYCEARAGRISNALIWMRAAHSHDPRAWQYVYGQAAIRAVAGQDPRPDIRAALALDPREPFLLDAQEIVHGTSPSSWRREAAYLRLPLVAAGGREAGGR